MAVSASVDHFQRRKRLGRDAGELGHVIAPAPAESTRSPMAIDGAPPA
ncbi:hypothetical protein [Streptosporangium sandarakinum]